MPQRNVATNFTFEQQRAEINLIAADFWSQKTLVDGAASTYLKHDGSNAYTGATLAVPNAFTINSNSGAGTVTISGNLQVDGTTTTVNTATMDVVDKNITIAKGSANDAAADGAGITIDSATDITWNFVDAKDAWVSSIGVESTTFLKAGQALEVNGLSSLQGAQFSGAAGASTGSGVDITAPDANTGQISAYNHGTTTYNPLNIKSASTKFYTGTTNALAATFNNAGLIMESGKTITGNVTGNLTGTASKVNLTSNNDDTSFRVPFTSGNSGSVDLYADNNNGMTYNPLTGLLYVQKLEGTVTTAAQPNITSVGTLNGTVEIQGSQAYADSANSLATAVSKAALRVKGSNNSSDSLWMGVETSDANPYIQGANDPGNATKKLLLNPFGGNVGIGTTAPGQLLEINGASNPCVLVKDTTNNVISYLYADDANAYVGSASNHPVVIQQNNGTAIHIDTNKNVSFNGTLDLPAVQGANNNHNSDVLFQDSNGVIDGGSGLTYNPAEDALKVNGLIITQGGINGNANSLNLSAANHSSTCSINVGSIVSVTNQLTCSNNGTSAKTAGRFENLTNDTAADCRVQIATFSNGGGDAFIHFDTGGSNMLVGNFYGGTTNNKLILGAGDSPSGTVKGFTIDGNGHVAPTSDNTYNLGSASNRWANVYTGDMHLNNMNTGGNEVDGSEGHWTMQEGSDDLFLINRNTGKKYKFNLTEVS